MIADAPRRRSLARGPRAAGSVRLPGGRRPHSPTVSRPSRRNPNSIRPNRLRRRS